MHDLLEFIPVFYQSMTEEKLFTLWIHRGQDEDFNTFKSRVTDSKTTLSDDEAQEAIERAQQIMKGGRI